MPKSLEPATHRSRRTLLAMAAVSPLLAARARSAEREAARAPAATPVDLLAAVRAYDAATVGNDVAALSELVRDDYLLVNSDSSVQDKASYLADFRVPGFRLDPYALEDAVWKRWDDVALLAGRVRLRWVLKGQRNERLLRVAHVWIASGSRWRLGYTQLTRIPE